MNKKTDQRKFSLKQRKNYVKIIEMIFAKQGSVIKKVQVTIYKISQRSSSQYEHFYFIFFHLSCTQKSESSIYFPIFLTTTESFRYSPPITTVQIQYLQCFSTNMHMVLSTLAKAILLYPTKIHQVLMSSIE